MRLAGRAAVPACDEVLAQIGGMGRWHRRSGAIPCRRMADKLTPESKLTLCVNAEWQRSLPASTLLGVAQKRLNQ